MDHPENRVGLVERVAMQIYLAEGGERSQPAYELQHPSVQARYERMAKAALTEAYLEPVAAPV